MKNCNFWVNYLSSGVCMSVCVCYDAEVMGREAVGLADGTKITTEALWRVHKSTSMI